MSSVKIKDSLIEKNYALYCGDCINVLPEIPDESVGFSVFSPPFVSLYSYSDDQADMGNARSYEEFFHHFGFLVKELHRVMMPGRVVAVHAMDLPTHKNDEGFIGIEDFPGDLVKAFKKEGFIFHSRVMIWKDPLIAATRTHALGLAHKQIVKDSAMCRMGIADQILAFRKDGDNPKPVENKYGLTEYHGSRPIPKELSRYVDWKGEQGINKRSHWIWQQYASPIWGDIQQTKVLPYKKGKEEDDERHVCPLQLQVIERCLALWSAPGDVVLSPFLGVGSEIYTAVKNGRKGIGIELKKSYYRQACRNLQSLKTRQASATSFF